MPPHVVMMVSEVPQIDLSSLSRQQLQHLLETSRRMGRTSMADAVAHEMRERRAEPQASRSWVEVDFSELASEPEPEPEFEFAPEPEPQDAAADIAEASEARPQIPPVQDLAPVGPADPYGFGAIRAVPDGILRISEPAPRRTAPRSRAPAPHMDARIARPPASRTRGFMLGAVALGAAAVAAVAAMVPLQRLQRPPAATPATPPAAQAALAPPGGPAVQPPPRAAVALTLRGPITSPVEPPVEPPAAAPAPAPGPPPSREFVIPAADLRAAADEANRIDMAKAQAEGVQGTWISPDFAPARCRWSRADPTLAVCQTRTRYAASRPWRERTGHYRRDADGAWQVAP